MTGRKDTKTYLWMLPLAMDESTISLAACTISQRALGVLEPIVVREAHQKTYSVPCLLANTNPNRCDIYVSASSSYRPNPAYDTSANYGRRKRIKNLPPA